jgi:hypothetical protein
MMDRTIRYEPLDDEERELMDPDTWAWEDAETHAGIPVPRVGLTIFFSRDELARLELAAREAAVSPCELIARATRNALEALVR